MDRLTACKKFFKIDKKTLLVKLHFFIYSLATSPVMAYFPVMVKNIGISAIALGIIHTIFPFVTILANPIFGWITDKFQRVKVVIIVMIIIETPLLFGTAFVPSLPTEIKSFPGQLHCSSDMYFVTFPKSLIVQHNRSVECNTTCPECLQSGTNSSNDVSLCGNDINLEIEVSRSVSHESVKVSNVYVRGAQISPNCHESSSSRCDTVCRIENGSKIEERSEFATYQFWTLLFLMVPALVLNDAVIAIGDAACYEALEGKVNLFGKQRLWLSVGWGVGTVITGLFLDLLNPNKEDKFDFSYCAYAMVILMMLDIITLKQATLKQAGISENIVKDVCKLFARPHLIFFSMAVLSIGMLTGVQWHYQFWYLEELGASKFMLGLSTAVICILVDSPFMFVSGWLVKRIGRDNTMVLAFISFAIWFLGSSYIYNPWLVLPLAFSQGPSYGLFYVAMTSYGEMVTAPGTEATMQTVLRTIFHGLGVGSGSLLGGLGFDLYSGRITYRFCGYFAVAVAVIYKLLTSFVAGENTAIYKGDAEVTNPVPKNSESKQEKN